MMVLDWLKRKLGADVYPTEQHMDEVYEEHRRSVEEANVIVSEQLEEVRQVRKESQDVHRRMTRLREENHFADMMARALGTR